MALKLKFGLAGAALIPELYQLEAVALLQAVQASTEVADTPEDLRRSIDARLEHGAIYG